MFWIKMLILGMVIGGLFCALGQYLLPTIG